METIVRSVTPIAAPAELVWDILVDFPRYPEWNTFTSRVSTSLALGSPVDMRVHLFPPLAQPQREFVVEHDPSRRRVAWGTTFGSPETGRALRTQEVVRVDAFGSRYITEDAIGGRMRRAIISGFGGAMQRGFDRVGAGLKARAEEEYARRRA